jgi:hypothetical protein
LWKNKKCLDTVDARYKHEDYKCRIFDCEYEQRNTQ